MIAGVDPRDLKTGTLRGEEIDPEHARATLSEGGPGKHGRENKYLEHPDDLEDEGAQDKFANRIADDLIALVNAHRKREGLQPLAK